MHLVSCHDLTWPLWRAKLPPNSGAEVEGLIWFGWTVLVCHQGASDWPLNRFNLSMYNSPSTKFAALANAALEGLLRCPTRGNTSMNQRKIWRPWGVLLMCVCFSQWLLWFCVGMSSTSKHVLAWRLASWKKHLHAASCSYCTLWPWHLCRVHFKISFVYLNREPKHAKTSGACLALLHHQSLWDEAVEPQETKCQGIFTNYHRASKAKVLYI